MKKKFLALAAVLLAGVSTLHAENGMFSGYLPENWTADVVASMKYTRHYYNNWSEDGTNTSTWLFRYDADIKGNWKYANWRNLINLSWGQNYTKGNGTRKSEDKIFWESTVDFNLFKVIKPYAGGRFESQFVKGFSYDDEGNKTPISTFMDPAYITQFAGLAYVPNDMFSQRIAFANRMTISDGYGFADDPDTKKFEGFRDEPGLESITEFKYGFMDIASFKSRLWAFVNFEGVEEIDGRWENTLAVMLTPYIEISIGVELFYDKDLDEDMQYKDSMLFGLTWRWF